MLFHFKLTVYHTEQRIRCQKTARRRIHKRLQMENNIKGVTSVTCVILRSASVTHNANYVFNYFRYQNLALNVVFRPRPFAYPVFWPSITRTIRVMALKGTDAKSATQLLGRTETLHQPSVSPLDYGILWSREKLGGTRLTRIWPMA